MLGGSSVGGARGVVAPRLLQRYRVRAVAYCRRAAGMLSAHVPAGMPAASPEREEPRQIGRQKVTRDSRQA